jgi:hypothetical protein
LQNAGAPMQNAGRTEKVQPMSPRCHPHYKEGFMSLAWYLRGGIRGTTYSRASLAFAAVFSLLIARSVPSDFSSAPSIHSSLHSTIHHDQRPRFRCDGSQWSVPLNYFFLVRPTSQSRHSAPHVALFSTRLTKGLPYDRPPPVS